MDDRQQQFVEIVAREVLAVMGSRGMISEPDGAAPADPPATVRPPIGTCTGDYSKFPELRGTVVAARGNDVAETSADSGGSPAEFQTGAAVPQTASLVASPAEPIALTGIITATQLQEAMDAGPDGVAVLAAGARLTPLATDLARQDPQKIRRVDTQRTEATASGTATDLPWLWWIDGECSTVLQVTQRRADRLRPCSAGQNQAALGQVVRDIAASLRVGRIAGAILFVNSAARAMCFANRCASVRAVVGTCGEALEQGVRELGANVLVIEYPHVGPRAMGGMVDRMLQQPPQVITQVQRELADLQRCG